MEETAGIYARESEYLDRYVQLGIAGGKVLRVSFPRAPEDDAVADHALLDRVDGYLEGAVDDFSNVDVGLTVPTAQRVVLEALRNVPHGEEVTVEQLTGMVPGLDPDDEGHREQVRTALAENPVPLLIPDHRVRDGPGGAPPEVEERLRAREGLAAD